MKILKLCFVLYFIASISFAQVPPPRKIRPIKKLNFTYSSHISKSPCNKKGIGEIYGLVQAVDSKTQKLAWKTRLYTKTYDCSKKVDSQDILIRSFKQKGGFLIIRDDQFSLYIVQMNNGKLSSPSTLKQYE